jgi:hypothetical protein
MIQSKSYGLQNETRQYLRRLYAYGRELAPADVADIDNFVKGLKQLNLWQNMVCYPLRSIHNIGTGSTVLSLGSLDRVSYNGTLVNSVTWSNTGLTFGGASQTSFATLPLDMRFPISYGASIFGCLNYQAGVSADDNFSLFLWQDLDGDPTFPSILINQNTSTGVVPVVTRNGARYFQSSRGGLFTQGFSTVGGILETTTQTNFRNGILISREVNLGVINPTTMNIGAPLCRIGRGNGTPGNVTCSISLISSRVLSNTDMTNLHNLYKTTIGKGLGLP